MSTNNLGYHAGDLGKAETYYQQSGGRSTGHFGTGTYFVGDPKKIENYNSRDGKPAPKHIVDFTPYNLYKPRDAEEADRLHYALKLLNNYSEYIANDELDAVLDVYDKLKLYIENDYYRTSLKSFWSLHPKEVIDMVNTLIDYYNKMESSYYAESNNLEHVELEDYEDRNSLWDVEDEIESKLTTIMKEYKLDRALENRKDFERFSWKLPWRISRDKAKEALKKVAEVKKHYNSEGGWSGSYRKGWDSLSTVFMKALGYEGVDVRHIPEFDNTTYGSVIYDLKPETIVEALQEAKQDRINFENKVGKELSDKFFSLKHRLTPPQNDLYYWMDKDISELENVLNSIEKSIKEKDDEAREGTDLIFENDTWLILKINTHEASKKYGKGTKWCISGEGDWQSRTSRYHNSKEVWDDYVNNHNANIWFFINKKDGHKYCVVECSMTLDGQTAVGLEIYDDSNRMITEIPNAPKTSVQTYSPITEQLFRILGNYIDTDKIVNLISYDPDQAMTHQDLRVDLDDGTTKYFRFDRYGRVHEIEEKDLDESLETNEFKLGTCGYIKEDGSLIQLDEYHGEDESLWKYRYPEFSNTHPEEDTCVRLYKEPNTAQYKRLEEIIDKYLDIESYCKVEIWNTKTHNPDFYETYSLFDGACEYLHNPEKVGNWTGYKLIEIIKNYFNRVDDKYITEKHVNSISRKQVSNILDKYHNEKNSRIYLFEVEPEQAKDYYIEKFDDGDIDFAQFTQHEQKDYDNKPTGKKYYSFMISGGLNGCGEWDDYLNDIKKVFIEFQDKLDLDPVLYKLETDICDDVWTGKVFLYENATEEQLSESLLAEHVTPISRDCGLEFEAKEVMKAKVKDWMCGEQPYEFQLEDIPDDLTWGKLIDAIKKGEMHKVISIDNAPQEHIWKRACELYYLQTGEYADKDFENLMNDPDKKDNLELVEKIVKVGNKWQVQSEKGRNMGTYDTKEEAKKRLQQIEYFKHLNESLLLEKTRSELIAKSKKSDNYSKNNQAKGKNRWERRKYSKIATKVADYNRIDMDAFFRGDILDFDVAVQGETNNYTVLVTFEGILDELRNQIKGNKGKLEFKCVLRALVNQFNKGAVYVSCSCPDWTYRQAYWSTKGQYNSGVPQPSNGKQIANPNDTKGAGCKHVNLVLANLDWLMKIASVINNYIYWARDNIEYQYGKFIFPQLYGMPYDKAIQLTLDMYDEDGNLKPEYTENKLRSDLSTINMSNMIGAKRTQYKKQPEVSVNPRYTPPRKEQPSNQTELDFGEEKELVTDEEDAE